MGYSVQERAECIGTFRWIEIRLMEMLARWVPTTPEMEIKILFGRHVWDCAQHADVLGRRAFELRAPLHYTLPAAPSYEALLREAAEVEPTAERVAVFYDALRPGLSARYRDYVSGTDALMDEPSVRILENALRDHERMHAERDRLAAQAGLAPAADAAAWLGRERALAGIVVHGGPRRAQGVRA